MSVTMSITVIVVAILTGLTICIPLASKLATASKEVVKEQNWSAVMDAAVKYIAQAETLYSTGADRKTWVMSMVEETASVVGYPLTDENKAKISDMIDAIVAASKLINQPTAEKAETSDSAT